MNPLLDYFHATEARRNARIALHSRLPGWRIYFRAEMGRAIRKWRNYKAAVRKATSRRSAA